MVIELFLFQRNLLTIRKQIKPNLIIMHNNKQKFREPHSNKVVQKNKNMTLSLPNKQSTFMNHFNELRDSKVTVSKASRATTSSQYQHALEKYCKVQSLIVKIQQSFDNGQICDMFKPIPKFSKSNGYLAFPNKISSSIASINQFFQIGKPLLKQNIIPSILNIDQYSDYLASYALVPQHFEELFEIKKQENKKLTKNGSFDAISQTVLAKNVIKSKVDLLIAEICSQKKRRDDSSFFEQGMNIKLNEFIDYVVEDDDRYLGLPIYSKAFQIDKNLILYKGKEIDGYLKIPLIQLFFTQLKELQKYKLTKLKQSKKKQEKMQICSEKDKKSVKSSSSKGGKYSEGHKKRQKQIQQEEWIGKLQ